MAKVVFALKLKREPGLMYFIKDGGAWSVPMKKPGVKAKGRKKKVAQFAMPGELDYSRNLYYIDKRGNVMASPRGRRRK